MSDVLRAAVAPSIQLVATAVIFAGAIGWPPSSGTMLLLPVGTEGLAAAIHVATAHGGTIVQTAPAFGSVVVRGDRNRLAAPLLARGFVPVAARVPGCGA